MKKGCFNILAPFSAIHDVQVLKDAGVDELYCGYITEDLKNKWPLAFNILNRRGEGSSFDNYAVFKEAISQAYKYNLPVYLTLNGLYTSQQYPLLLSLVNNIQSLPGIKGIIVADIGLLLYLKKSKFKKEIHISTIAGCFNSLTADFYKELGANRVILDRQLTVEEIKDIISRIKSDIDIEILIIRENCGGFIDSLCTFLHCSEQLELNTETIKKNVSLIKAYDTEICDLGCEFYFKKLANGNFETFDSLTELSKPMNLKYDRDKHHGFGCRICDLYDLKEYPIKSLKIVGRGKSSQEISKFVKLLLRVLNNLKQADISKSEFQSKCKALFSKVAFNGKKMCSNFDCYFSNSLVKNEK
jgi:putative protease